MVYPCIPKWLTPNERDEFNYKLRTKEEIYKDIKENPRDLKINIWKKNYLNYKQKSMSRVNDNREEVCKLSIKVASMKLAPLQKARLLYLVKGRHKNGVFKIVSKRYNSYMENLEKAYETLKEVFLEALRAPTTPVNIIKNPYTRDNLKAKQRHKIYKEELMKLLK